MLCICTYGDTLCIHTHVRINFTSLVQHIFAKEQPLFPDLDFALSVLLTFARACLHCDLNRQTRRVISSNRIPPKMCRGHLHQHTLNGLESVTLFISKPHHKVPLPRYFSHVPFSCSLSYHMHGTSTGGDFVGAIRKSLLQGLAAAVRLQVKGLFRGVEIWNGPRR
jgi:hypothetical protein